jgi:zinc protease
MYQFFLGIVLVASITSCATKGGSGNSSGYHLRPYKEVTLDNGLRLLLIEDHSLPRVSMGILLQVGSLDEPAGKYGIASFTSSLLEQGTQTRTATQIADELGQIASDLGTSSGTESTSVSASVINTQKEKLLDLFSDVLLNPAFDKKEIERAKAQALALISREQDNPSNYAEILIDRVSFPNHAYGRPTIGDKKSVETFKQSDLQDFYKKFYRPNNAIMYVAGDFDQNFIDQVKSHFSNWQKAPIPVQKTSQFKSTPSRDVQLFTKADLKQAQIRFAELGIRRSDPDYLPLRIANIILGGDFVSRLNMRVRDDLGLTYSIHSSSDAKLEAGSLQISTFSRNEKVGETIRETREVIKKFVEGGITAEELSSAKALLAGQFPAAIETTDKLAYNLQILRRYGVSDSYLHDFVKNLNAVTLEQVNEVIKKHVHPDEFKTIVFADESKVLGQLKSLGKVEVEKVRPE